jgi:SMC interacting uncharacterized protein involved in chromosome segregation
MSELERRLRADLDLNYQVLRRLRDDNEVLKRRNQRLTEDRQKLMNQVKLDAERRREQTARLDELTRGKHALEQQNRLLGTQMDQLCTAARSDNVEDDADGLLVLLQDLLNEVRRSHQENWELHDFVREVIDAPPRPESQAETL